MLADATRSYHESLAGLLGSWPAQRLSFDMAFERHCFIDLDVAHCSLSQVRVVACDLWLVFSAQRHRGERLCLTPFLYPLLLVASALSAYQIWVVHLVRQLAQHRAILLGVDRYAFHPTTKAVGQSLECTHSHALSLSNK